MTATTESLSFVTHCQSSGDVITSLDTFTVALSELASYVCTCSMHYVHTGSCGFKNCWVCRACALASAQAWLTQHFLKPQDPGLVLQSCKLIWQTMSPRFLDHLGSGTVVWHGRVYSRERELNSDSVAFVWFQQTAQDSITWLRLLSVLLLCLVSVWCSWTYRIKLTDCWYAVLCQVIHSL